MEKYHEVLTPVKEIARSIGSFVLEKIVPHEAIEGIYNEAVSRTAQVFDFSDRVIPDIAGRDLLRREE